MDKKDNSLHQKFKHNQDSKYCDNDTQDEVAFWCLLNWLDYDNDGFYRLKFIDKKWF